MANMSAFQANDESSILSARTIEFILNNSIDGVILFMFVKMILYMYSQSIARVFSAHRKLKACVSENPVLLRQRPRGRLAFIDRL